MLQLVPPQKPQCSNESPVVWMKSLEKSYYYPEVSNMDAFTERKASIPGAYETVQNIINRMPAQPLAEVKLLW